MREVYYFKYLKYKNKYLELQKQLGGEICKDKKEIKKIDCISNERKKKVDILKKANRSWDDNKYKDYDDYTEKEFKTLIDKEKLLFEAGISFEDMKKYMDKIYTIQNIKDIIQKKDLFEKAGIPLQKDFQEYTVDQINDFIKLHNDIIISRLDNYIRSGNISIKETSQLTTGEQQKFIEVFKKNIKDIKEKVLTKKNSTQQIMLYNIFENIFIYYIIKKKIVMRWKWLSEVDHNQISEDTIINIDEVIKTLIKLFEVGLFNFDTYYISISYYKNETIVNNIIEIINTLINILKDTNITIDKIDKIDKIILLDQDFSIMFDFIYRLIDNEYFTDNKDNIIKILNNTKGQNNIKKVENIMKIFTKLNYYFEKIKFDNLNVEDNINYLLKICLEFPDFNIDELRKTIDNTPIKETYDLLIASKK